MLREILSCDRCKKEIKSWNDDRCANMKDTGHLCSKCYKKYKKTIKDFLKGDLE